MLNQHLISYMNLHDVSVTENNFLQILNESLEYFHLQ